MTVRNKINNASRPNFNVTAVSIFILCLFVLISSACKVSYKFNEVSIPPEIKTVRVSYIDNQARYKNTQLSPQLTDKLRQKIVNQTKLTSITGEADYDISGYISQYDVSTSGISDQKVATNRLTVGVTITVKNNKDLTKEPQNFSISRNFDFSATLTLQQAEQRLNDEMIRSLTDDIFNRIFSNWE